jgi:serine/threonine protein kinase
MEKTGRLEIPRSVEIIKQVLSGLAHAHELGIVHRDIKPANIMISEKAGYGQQVRILDFGLARLTESSTKLTTGIVVGTPNYMAPEQCKGSDIDARTDLYACGVMLFEMLTGRKPFIADDPIQVVRKHLLEKPPTLASVEPNVDFGKLEEVIAKALSKAPADRYDSAVIMAKAVEAAAQGPIKTAAAAVYARAIPDSKAPPIGNVQATMSGWNVPQSDSGPTSAGSGPSSGPTSAHGPDSSFAPPVTESQFVDAIVPPPGSPLGTPTANTSTPSGPAESTRVDERRQRTCELERECPGRGQQRCARSIDEHSADAPRASRRCSQARSAAVHEEADDDRGRRPARRHPRHCDRRGWRLEEGLDDEGPGRKARARPAEARRRRHRFDHRARQPAHRVRRG